MRSEALRFLLIGIAAVALSACGQKGPLYLPDKTGEVVTRPSSTPTPAPAETPPAPAPNPTTDDSGSEEAEKPK